MSGSSSQLSIGVTPEMSEKISHTTRFSPRLNIASSTTEAGITRRGKWILRSMFSRSTIDRTAPPVASPKNWNSTIEPSSCEPYCSMPGWLESLTWPIWVKNTQITPNSSSGRTSVHR